MRPSPTPPPACGRRQTSVRRGGMATHCEIGGALREHTSEEGSTIWMIKPVPRARTCQDAPPARHDPKVDAELEHGRCHPRVVLVALARGAVLLWGSWPVDVRPLVAQTVAHALPIVPLHLTGKLLLEREHGLGENIVEPADVRITRRVPQRDCGGAPLAVCHRRELARLEWRPVGGGDYE